MGDYRNSHNCRKRKKDIAPISRLSVPKRKLIGDKFSGSKEYLDFPKKKPIIFAYFPVLYDFQARYQNIVDEIGQNGMIKPSANSIITF